MKDFEVEADGHDFHIDFEVVLFFVKLQTEAGLEEGVDFRIWMLEFGDEVVLFVLFVFLLRF